MIFLSRMTKNGLVGQPVSPGKSNIVASERTKGNGAKIAAPASTGNGGGHTTTLDIYGDQRMEGTDVDVAMAVKLRCAESIYSISYHKNNEAQMLREGVMQTILGLMAPEDVNIRLYLSGALVNLSVSVECRQKMIDDGAIQVTLELAHAMEPETRHNCALVLYQFSGDEHHHFKLVQDGCAVSLLQLMSTGQDATKEICMKALINLAALPRSMVNDSILNTMVHIAKLGSLDTKKGCTKGLLNLSIMATTRVAIVEDGAILALRILSNDTDAEIQELISCILCNLAAIRSNQELMVKNGALSILNDLLLIKESTIIQRNCSTILSYLSCNARLQQRMVESGFVTQLVRLLSVNHLETKRLITLAISNLASHYDSRPRMVKDKAVQPLIDLMLESEDMCIKQDCVVGLCSLMSHPSTYLEMVDQGVVFSFVKLSTSDDAGIQRACALALLNLSYDELMQVKIAEQGVIPSLIKLTSTPNQALQKMCITTMYNLSQRLENAECLLYEGVVSLIVMLLNDKNVTNGLAIATMEVQRQQCCAILCNLSNYQKGRQGMLEAGAVDAIVRITSELANPVSKKGKSKKPEDQSCPNRINCTRAFASGTLCNLSVVAMKMQSYFPTLLQLASSHDVTSTHRCSLAFSNISHCATGRRLLAKNENIAPGLNAMMRTGNHETQVNAAIALCNIATERGPRSNVWSSGAVADFIVIALLRINSEDTKEICAKTLYNLLSHVDTRDIMIADGALYALIKLGKLVDRTSIRDLCIRAIYNISLDVKRIPGLIDNEVVRVVTQMYQPEYSKDLKRYISAIVSNLSTCQGRELQMISEGILTITKTLAKVKDVDIRVSCATIISNLSCNVLEVPPIFVNDDILPLLSTLSRSDLAPIRLCSAGAICNITANETVRSEIVKSAENSTTLFNTITGLMQISGCKKSVALCAKALNNLTSDDVPNQVKLVQCNAIRVFSNVFSSSEDLETLCICGKILCSLANLNDSKSQLKIVADGIVRSFVSIAQGLRGTDDDGSPTATMEGSFVKPLDIVTALCNLSGFSECHRQILNDGAVEAIIFLSGFDQPEKQRRSSSNAGNFTHMDESFALNCAITIRNLSTSTEDGNRAKIVSQSGLLRALIALSYCPKMETKENAAIAIYNLSCYKRSRTQIITLGGVEALVKLANTCNPNIRQICGLALHSLSTHSNNIMQGGLMKSIASLAEASGLAVAAAADIASSVIRGSQAPSSTKIVLLRGAEQTTKQANLLPEWKACDMKPEELVAFSIDDTQVDENAKATPPRQCTFDAVIGELEYLQGPYKKHKVLNRAEIADNATKTSQDLPALSGRSTDSERKDSLNITSSASQIRIDAIQDVSLDHSEGKNSSRSPKRCASPKKLSARNLDPI